VTAQLDVGGEPTTFETGSGLVAALRSGEPGAPAVLMLPGYTGSKEDFAPVLAPLALAGFAVAAIDLPGQYESPGPADPTAYTTDALGAVVRELAATLGPQVHLVGHSFGGLVARAAVLTGPTAFASLALMCSGPAALGGERAQLIEYLEPVLAASGLAAVYAASLALYRAQAGYVEPPAPLAAFLERRFVAGAPAMLQGMGVALRTEPDRVAELATVSIPTLVLHGVDDDAWLPAVQHDMAQRLGAEYVVIPDAAHSPAVENPAQTASALAEFWNRV
jgi:pimeloyl-ACP methyl ester carboxylesterase